MRRIVVTLGVVGLMAGGVRFAAAQEVGTELTLTGCLARESDEAGEAEEAEFLLRNVTDETVMADEIELLAGEGVNLAPHVGHTVQVTGVVVADDDEGEGAEAEEQQEEEMQEGRKMELHIRVTGLRHVATSCQEGPQPQR